MGWESESSSMALRTRVMLCATERACSLNPLISSCCPSSARAILWADGAIPSIREDAIASLRRRNLPMRTKSGDAFTARARAST